VNPGKKLPMLKRKVLPPSSGSTSKPSNKEKQSILKMGAVRSSELSTNICKTTRPHILDDSSLPVSLCWNTFTALDTIVALQIFFILVGDVSEIASRRRRQRMLKSSCAYLRDWLLPERPGFDFCQEQILYCE
jgi:hypothetical protein